MERNLHRPGGGGGETRPRDRRYLTQMERDLHGPGKTQPRGIRKEGMRTNHPLRPPVCRLDGPPVDVVAWRRCRLLEAGFAETLAVRLANAAVDVHALLQLVDRGCPPELAARILAPIGFRFEPAAQRAPLPQTGTSA
jgi:hypothetical protein